MNPNSFLEIFKNVNAGPMSTAMGLVFFLVGGSMVWSTYNETNGVVWTSFEVVVFAAGCGLLLLNDKWLKTLFKNGDKG